LSIVLILVGAIAGGVWGFKDPQFNVAEGSSRALGMGTDLSLRLDHFAADYYADGRPRDYSSEVTVLDHGRIAGQATIRVNSPLRYGGIAFHQASFGQAAVLRVQDSDGQVLFEGGIPLALQSQDSGRPVGTVGLAEGESIYVTGPSVGTADPLINAGQVRVELYEDYVRAAAPVTLSQGVPKTVDGLTVTFERESWFTGLKVVKDPGTNIIWVACALMFAGLGMLFYLPRHRAWALCRRDPGGTTSIVVAMPSERDSSPEHEFQRLMDRVGTDVAGRRVAPEGGHDD
jgi:cytochrome c biogenesis protein